MFYSLLTTASNADFSAITDALKTSFSVGQVGAVIGIVIASTSGIVVMWWGARKLTNSIYKAFKDGKIKF
jgi:hypothetical protein